MSYKNKYLKYKTKYINYKKQVGNANLPEDILYLVHVTNEDPTDYKELKTPSLNINDQFPGIYFTLITKDNIEVEQLFPGKYIMIFSCELLKQKNYHINIRDYNGFISEKNTFYPWSLDKAVNEISSDKKHSNEVVFHDNITYNFLCNIIEYNDKFKLPSHKCLTNEPPDLTKLPFYAFCFEYKYTGIDTISPSSFIFFIKMALLAKLNPIPKTKEEIIKAIEAKVPYLLENRSEQYIDILRK